MPNLSASVSILDVWDGLRGTGLYYITTEPTGYTTPTGGFTPTYRIALSTVLAQTGADDILIGDTLQNSYYHYPVGYVDGNYVYLGDRVSIRGQSGENGTNAAQVVLYKRGATAPAKPTAALTYTFATGKVSGSMSGWTQAIPSGTDPLWAITASASASATSTTDSIAASEWTTQEKILENGTDGLNQATIYLYRRASSAPSKPTATPTYTFSTGALSSVPSGWYRTIPATDGNPCYVTSAAAIGSGTTATVSGWADVTKLVEDGVDADPLTITSTSVTYQKSTSGTVTPTGSWDSSIPSMGEGEYLWTKTVVNYSDNSSTEAYSVSRNATNGTSPTVSSTVVEYQQSNAGTTPPTGTWSSTAPSATAGYYMWTRTTVTYSDGATSISYNVSKNGTNGSNATAYHLIVSHAAIGKDQSGTYNPTSITLTGKSQTGTSAMANYSGRFKIETTTNNSTWTSKYTSSSNEATKSYTVPDGIIAIRCSLYLAGGTSTLLDQQTVPIVTDGTDGDDAYTVILTNESHTFPGTETTAVNGSTATCGIIAYKGATQTSCYAGASSSATSISTGITGLTCAITNNNSTSVTLTFTAANTLTNDVLQNTHGEVSVPVTVDGKSFIKIFTVSVAFKGSSLTVTEVKYAVSTTDAQPSDSSFTYSSMPSVSDGEYIWTRVTYSDNTKVYSKSYQGKDGEGGQPGTSYYTYVRYSANSDGSSMVETPTSATKYIGVYSGTASTCPAYNDPGFKWSLYVGANGKMLYGTCSTQASTATKTVVCTDATELYAGMTITVRFSTANTASGPSLDVNSLGAKSIYFAGKTATTNNANLFLWGAGATIQFTCIIISDVYYWVPTGHPCTYYGACSTAAPNSPKASTIDQVVVCKGTTVFLQMSNANTAESAKLNVSSTGEYDIYANGAVLADNSQYNWTANSNVSFTFDGQRWRMGDTTSFAASVLAQTAQTTAEGKVTVYYQSISSPPSSAAVGDLLIDTTLDGDGHPKNDLYRYNGTTWVSVDNRSIQDALNNAATAQATADGKITTYASPSDPSSSETMDDGDLWIDTDDNNHMYRWDGTNSAWVDVEASYDIGGRNLIAGTATPYTATCAASTEDGAYTESYYNTPFGVDVISSSLVDDLYVISCDWAQTGSSTAGYFYMQYNGAICNAVYSRGAYADWSTGHMSGHMVGLFKLKSDQISGATTSNGFRVRLSETSGAGSAIVTISNAKLEKANVATAWTPAPEDTDTVIAEAQALASEALSHRTYFATCNTVSGTAAKVASLSGDDIALTAGSVLIVTFSEANTAENPTLSVGNYGNIPIMAGASPLPSSYYWGNNTTVTFVYDGENWQMDGTAAMNIANGVNSELSNAISSLDNRLTGSVDYVQGQLNTYIAEVGQYLQFNNTKGLVIGAQNSDFNTQITNERMSFRNGNNEVAYISGQELNIPNAVINQYMTIGKFRFAPRPNGSVGIIWTG